MYPSAEVSVRGQDAFADFVRREKRRKQNGGEVSSEDTGSEQAVPIEVHVNDKSG